MSACQYFPLTSSSKVSSSHWRSPSSRSWQFSMVMGGNWSTSFNFSSVMSTPFFQSSTSSSLSSISHHGSSGLPIVTFTIASAEEDNANSVQGTTPLTGSPSLLEPK